MGELRFVSFRGLFTRLAADELIFPASTPLPGDSYRFHRVNIITPSRDSYHYSEKIKGNEGAIAYTLLPHPFPWLYWP